MSNTKLTLVVAGLVLVGLLTGVAVGSGDEDPSEIRAVTIARTVVSTDTVTNTETVTRTRVKVKVRYKTRVKIKYRTVTEPAPAYGDDPDTGSGDAGCSDEYVGACVPADAYDVDCGELVESDFDSVGSDPYGLDADGDGVACES